MSISLLFDGSIIDAYLSGSPSTDYANHWVYREAQGSLVDQGYAFSQPPDGYEADVALIFEHMQHKLKGFIFRNDSLIRELFGNKLLMLGSAVVLPAVGLFGDAMALLHEGRGYAVFDLIRLVDSIRAGKDADSLLENLLTHELTHLLIGFDYPPGNFTYAEYLDWISFHEGFAHLLSYREDIANYKPDDTDKAHFERARSRLAEALTETDPTRQAKFTRHVNMGAYWDKFGAIASMLYLMRHVKDLGDIYAAGWRGYCHKVIAHSWRD